MAIIHKTFAAWFATALLLFVAGDHYLNAQSVSIYSAIVGTVTDPSGGSVSNATVTATNASTNISISAVTDSQGFYRIDRLVLGTYTLSVTKTGFQAVMDQGIHMSSAQTVRTDFKLQVGSIAQ
ncbi:MAG TPA: carboxypeptidase-like regulatory domain-containing protein, partial [Bryobacteraceae bacterium]|nr:carboxypeptidase-like regulatory domain-containing protein [Bryobacteraceae bacterium]